MTFRFSLIVLLFTCGSFLAPPAFADSFELARQLLKDKKPDEAYRFLVDKEGYHLGEPEYDLLLARTALAAGFSHEAIFAFERVLIQNPGNLMARIEMAIAYFRIDELENAQRHLNIVLAVKPTGEVKKILDEYMEVINDKIASRKNELNISHAFAQGWDSNINSATNESEIKLEIGNYRPTEGVDKKTSDTFTELNNQLHYTHHLNVNAKWFSNLNYKIRENNTKDFDAQSANVSLGYKHQTSIGEIQLPYTYQATWIDEVQQRYVNSLGASLNRKDKFTYSNYSLQYGEVRYPSQSALDVNQVLFSYVIGTHDNDSIVNQQYAFFYGDEDELDSRYRFNARKYMGMQIRFPVRLNAEQYLYPRLVYQKAEYKQKHPFFFQTREDTHISAAVDWSWYLNRHWQLNGQLSHSLNNSTVELYTYDRTVISAGFTYKY